MASLSIELQNVSRAYEPARPALCSLTLEIAPGERLAVLGPSGSGKTTLLRLIAGLERPDRGTIRIGGRDVNETPPHRRQVAMVFQSPALYPHLSVRKNLVFGLRARGFSRRLRWERAGELAEMLELSTLMQRRPAALSGGERQRVALGRALARDPAVLLLDEPFSSLDAPLRDELRTRLIELHRRQGCTLIHVTHDQEEAMSLGQRVAVLKEGRLIQWDTPREVHDRPANLFVASFVGSPGMNLLDCLVIEDQGSTRVRLADVSDGQAVADGPSRRLILGVRPEDARISEPSGEAPQDVLDQRLRVSATILDVEYQGRSTLVTTRLMSQPLRVRTRDDAGLAQGQPVRVEIDLSKVSWFDPESGRRLEPDCQPITQAIA